jgi:hypothetical protein
MGATSYALIADNLLAHGSYTTDGQSPATYRAPLYVLLVVISKLLGGGNWSRVLLLLQAAACVTTGILISRMTVRLTGNELLAAGVTLTYACHLAWIDETLVLRESVLFGLLIAWFFYHASSRQITARILAGMTLACLLAYYTRGTGFLLIVPLIVLIAAHSQATRTQRMVLAATVAGALVLGITPWQVFQTRVSGQTTLAPTSVGGEQLYIGNSKMFDQVPPYLDVDAGSFVYRTKLNDSIVDATSLSAQAAADITADPLRFFRKVWLKATVYLSPFSTPLGRGSLEVTEGSLRISSYEGNLVRAARNWVPFAVHVASFFVVLFVIPLGFLGNAREAIFSRSNRGIAIASLFFIGVNLGLHALLTAETRYRLYLDPLFIVWAWIALAAIFGSRAKAEAADLSAAA